MDSSLETEHLTRLTRRRLADLDRTRAQVAALEQRASLISDYAHEQRKIEILDTMFGALHKLSPALAHMGSYVAELKKYLQSTYEADLVGDPAVQSMTADHAVGYAVRLLDMMSDASKFTAKGSFGVLELASSTLSMFAQRPSAYPAIRDTGAIGVMVKLLSPLYPAVAVAHMCNTVGHLAADVDCRLAFRAAGGVGALVRLLRADCEPTVQTAAAAALSLLAARDLVVQDSVRYLGGIDHLVDMLASPDSYLAEVARYALLSLRHHNVKNQVEIMTTTRASPSLAKDVRRLEAAADLLRFEDDPPRRATLSPTRRQTAARHKLFEDILLTPTRPRTADSYLRSPSTPTYLPGSPTYRSPTSAAYSPLALALATPSYLPLSSTYETIKAQAFSSELRRLTSPGRGRELFPGGDEYPLPSLLSVEADIFKKRHLARYSEDDLVALLERLGFDALDLRSVRQRWLDGPRLLAMTEDDLELQLLLPSSKQRKLVQLQRATRLFDRIATLPRQGKVSEVEVRLHLSGLGVYHDDATKTIKLLRALVKVDSFDFITFFDFVMGYEWIAQAFRIYGVRA